MSISQQEIQNIIVKMHNYARANNLNNIGNVYKHSGNVYEICDSRLLQDQSNTKFIAFNAYTEDFTHIDEMLKMFSEEVENDNTIKIYSKVNDRLITYSTPITEKANVTLFIKGA